jgi:hypothetical protein
MANPIPASYYPRRTDNSDIDETSADAVAEHDQLDEPTLPSGGAKASPDGGDAGTKGTGSAG